MQITIQLDDKARRPIANLNWFHGCRALIDTGALFPIWNGSGSTLADGMIYEIDTITKTLRIDTKDNQPVRILRLSNDNSNLSAYLAETYKTESDYRKAMTSKPIH